MYRLPSCAECVPPTWLAPGLDQGPSSLLPAWYQFWSFLAAPSSQFRQGRRTDLSPRGRVPQYASRRSTCITASGLSRFRRTTTQPLSNTLVMSAGPNHGNCSFVPRVRSSGRLQLPEFLTSKVWGRPLHQPVHLVPVVSVVPFAGSGFG